MPSFICAHYSRSASGTNSGLTFDSSGYHKVALSNGTRVPFFQMHGIEIDQTSVRIKDCLIEAVEQLLEQAQLSLEERKNTALILGSTSLDIGTITPQDNQDIWLTNTDKLSGFIVEHFGLGDFHLTINTACTASTNAMILGDQLLQQGKAKHVIVVGCEFYNDLTLKGFQSLDLISDSQLMTFSQHRSGLILGEGVGALLLSSAQPRKKCFKIVGSGSGCDHHSLTMTQESGAHIVEVVEQCLAKAHLASEDIDLIKVHGTATLNNDEAETNAFAERFAHAPIMALKPFIGHTLGACGAIEVALMCDLLESGAVIPMPSYVTEKDKDTLMPFAKDKAISDFRRILLNHCGFGGNNAAIIVEVVSK